jgi:rsbT co-antagonist protein RsbR
MAKEKAQNDGENALDAVLTNSDADLLAHWMREQITATTLRKDLLDEVQLREQSRRFLDVFRSAAQTGNTDVRSPVWANVRDVLSQISRERAAQGFSPSETATFVLSLKQPIFARLREQAGNSLDAYDNAIWTATVLIDKLGLFTVEQFMKTREELIRRQQQEMLELSTPVVKLFEGVLALPLIGTLDSARTQVVMENLLQRIVETGASIAIIDITGVPTVDTLVAQHLLKTVAAARLMGADCIISGIRPQIAQTIVHLGVNLGQVITKASLADAFLLALQRLGLLIRKEASNAAPRTEPREER